MIMAKGISTAAFIWSILLQVDTNSFVIANESNDVHATTLSDNNDDPQNRVPPDCGLVMAPSSIDSAGWGVFTLVDRPRGSPLAAGDVVIQVSDINVTHGIGMQRLVYDYAWNAAETGGQYEGQFVLSLIPGLGMLANGSPHKFSLLPVLEPSVDEAGVTRHSSPGAGAFTHYHNYSFHAARDISAGEEVLVNYGPIWFRDGRRDLTQAEEEKRLQQNKEDLMKTGYCLDNLKSADSTIPHAGRGAFATRDLDRGSIVAPVPVVPITKREALDISRIKQVSETQYVTAHLKQLLLNYCFGHPKSSVLLFPYSPIVSLINHARGVKTPNVRLQWSSSNQQHEILTLEDLREINRQGTYHKSTGGLLLELVALEEIKNGEEIVMDYGQVWEDAWQQHVQSWTPYEKAYAPAFAADEGITILSTQKELEDKPNPSNLITSCFYRYHKDDPALHARGDPARNISSAPWQLQPGIFELRNLRPCTIMQRTEVDNTQDDSSDDEDKEPSYYYTVVVRNRYGLHADERVPLGHVHIATQVPRRAIRFTDKIYTTDQHLEGAFREPIGLGDDIFPQQWMDLA